MNKGNTGAASIMEGGKRPADGETTVQDRETRKKAKVVDIVFVINLGLSYLLLI